MKKYPEKRAVLTEGKAFSDKIIDAFVEGELIRWKTELISRIIPENRMLISKFKEIKSAYVTDEDSTIGINSTAFVIILLKTASIINPYSLS